MCGVLGVLLHVFYICIIHVSATHLLYLYIYTCNTCVGYTQSYITYIYFYTYNTLIVVYTTVPYRIILAQQQVISK